MNQKEREWLIRIQKLQLESSITDPYVEDYYAMCYNSKVRLVDLNCMDLNKGFVPTTI